MDSTLEVPSGKELEISGNVALIVPNGEEATITGTVTVKNGGTLDFSDLDDDKVTLTGTITVESGGIFAVKTTTDPNKSAVNYNAGTLVLKEDSSAYLNNTLMIGPDSSGALFEWSAVGTGASMEFSEAGGINIITLKDGKITVKGLGDTPVQAAVIYSGATLVVDPGMSFAVVISLVVNGRLEANKPIVGGIDGVSTITFDIGADLTGTYVDDTTGNFFKDSGSTQEAAEPGTTYTWNTDHWERPSPKTRDPC
jgi:hypothetical protein